MSVRMSEGPDGIRMPMWMPPPPLLPPMRRGWRRPPRSAAAEQKAAEHLPEAAEEVAVRRGTPALEGRLDPLLEPLLPGSHARLVGSELRRPLLAAVADPGEHVRQLVGVEPDAVAAADV